MAVCVQSYVNLLKHMDQSPLVLSELQAQQIYEAGQLHLETWANLRSLSNLVRRGRVPNRSLWMILPKMHHLKHCLDDTVATRVNPNASNLLAAESWVGAVGRMSRILAYNFNVHACKYQNPHAPRLLDPPTRSPNNCTYILYAHSPQSLYMLQAMPLQAMNPTKALPDLFVRRPCRFAPTGLCRHLSASRTPGQIYSSCITMLCI